MASIQKGGCGKTTSALNLGTALGIVGKKVVLIDNDVQDNLTAGLGYTPVEQPHTLANLLPAAIDYPKDLDFHLQRIAIHTEAGINLIPASSRLADTATGPWLCNFLV